MSLAIPGMVVDSEPNMATTPYAGWGVRLPGATSGSFRLVPASIAGDVTLTAPVTVLAGGLISNASGVTSFETPSATRTRLGLGTGDDVIFGNISATSLTLPGGATVVGSEITVHDPLIKLAADNVADVLDTGFYAKYVSAGDKYTGLFRDASDGKYKLFTGLTVEPTTTVNTAGAGYTTGTLVVGTIEATTYVGYPTTNPAGSGSEVQYRSDATTFGAVTGSSFASSLLTLPIVQATKLGVGIDPTVGGHVVEVSGALTSGSLVYLASVNTDANSHSTLNVNATEQGTGSASYQCIRSQMFLSNSGFTGNGYAINAAINNNGNAGSGNLYGIQSTATQSSGTKVVYGGRFSAVRTAGTATALYGVTIVNTGATADSYGVHIATNATATNDWGVYSLSTKNYFSGNVSIGILPTPSTLFHIATGTDALGIATLEQASTVAADGFDLNFRRCRGTVASPTVITTGDALGTITGYGYSGAGGYVAGAQIRFESTGTVATTRVPGKIVFATGTDAAPTVMTDRLTIDSSGIATFVGTSGITDYVRFTSTAFTAATNYITLFNNASLQFSPAFYAKSTGAGGCLGFIYDYVGNNSSLDAGVYFQVRNGAASYSTANAIAFTFANYGTSLVSIAASGLVGINKSSSIGAQLHVVSSGATVPGMIIAGPTSMSVSMVQLNQGLTPGAGCNFLSCTSSGGAEGDRFKVDRNGEVTTTAGFSIWSSSECRIESYGGGRAMLFTAESAFIAMMKSNQFRLLSTALLSWSNGSPWGGTTDVAFGRNAAGVIEVNNGTLGSLAALTGTTFTGSVSVLTPLIGNGATGIKIGSAAGDKVAFHGGTAQAQDTGWAVTNKTTDRVLDCNATTVDELADVLGTLIDVLKARGDLGA